MASVSKAHVYAVLSTSLGAGAAKANVYAVLSTEVNVSVAKAVAYVVLAPPPRILRVEARPADGVLRVTVDDPTAVGGALVVHAAPGADFDVDAPAAVDEYTFDIPLAVNQALLFDPTPDRLAGIAYPLPAFTLAPPGGRAAQSDPAPPAPTGRAQERP